MNLRHPVFGPGDYYPEKLSLHKDNTKQQAFCVLHGNNGHNGQFCTQIVDQVDIMDAITPCGQQTVILYIRLLQVRVLPGAP